MNRGASPSCWVDIDLHAIERNVYLIKEQTGVQVMAVVKANAYGHGAVPVAEAALQGGATWLGVARPEEALELRSANIEAPILLLGLTPSSRFAEVIENDISITIWDLDQLDEASLAAQSVRKPVKLHLKVDTGMNRLGVQPDNALHLAQKIISTSQATFEGIFTHFARADEPDSVTTEAQEGQLRHVLNELEEIGIKPGLVHAANSAAGLTRPTAYFNLVRAGISIYGLHPSPGCPLPSGFAPALTWKTIISQVKVVPAGRGISYGHEHITKQEEHIGTLPVGYADGFRRVPGNSVLVGGRKVPVVGRVCMDQIMVNLDLVPGAKPGDEAVLIGKQGDASITAEDIAGTWGTINYEVVCGIGPRVPRLYLDMRI